MITEFLTYDEKVKNLSENTIRAYGNDMHDFARYLSGHLGIRRWGDVHKTDVDKYLMFLHDMKKKPATIRRALATIRAFYNYAIKAGKTETNPARYCEAPKRERSLPTTIDTTAIETYIDDVTKPLALRAIIALIYETGMRISEVTALETRDVNPREHSIRVYCGKGLKTRIVYYGYRTQRLMNAYVGTRKGKIFQGAEENQRQLRYEIWRALKGNTIGEREASPHIIRHTYATKMLNQGMSISSLQMLMGHESSKTTEIYAHMANATVKSDYMRAQV